MRLHSCAVPPRRPLHGRTAWLPRSSLLCTRAAQAVHARSDHCTTASTSSRLEVYVVSDLHTDFQDNMRWVEQLAAHRSKNTATPHASSRGHRLSTDTAQQQPCYRDVQSVLLVAGDVSDCLQTLERTLRLLQRCFTYVFFIPGNHELWVTGPEERHGGATDSCGKLQRVLALCRRLGVHVDPKQLGPQLTIAPLHAWHHKCWDREPDIPGIPRPGPLTISDYAKCRWPEAVAGPEGQGSLQLAQWIDSLNDAPGGAHLQGLTSAAAAHGSGSQGTGASLHGDGSSRQPEPAGAREHESSSSSSNSSQVRGSSGHDAGSQTEGSADRAAPASSSSRGVSSAGSASKKVDGQAGMDARRGRPHIISFSHFLPDQRLSPEKRYLSYPYLAKAIGSDPLRARIQSLQPIAHVFGHTHFAWDAVLDGVRYVQAPLCYPLERKHRAKTVSLSSQWQQEGALQQHAQQAQHAQHTQQAQHAQQQGQSQQDARPHGHAEAQAAPAPVVPWLPLLLYRAHYTVRTDTATLQSRVKAGACSTPAGPDAEPDQARSSPGASSSCPQVLQPRPMAAVGHSQDCGASGSGGHAASNDLLTQFWRERFWADQHSHSHSPQQHRSAAEHSSNVAVDTAPLAPHANSSLNGGGNNNDASSSPGCAKPSSTSPATSTAHPAAAAAGQLPLPPPPDWDAVRVEITDWQGELCPKLQGASWSTYYESHGRTPENLELAPWVAGLYARRLASMKQASA